MPVYSQFFGALVVNCETGEVVWDDIAQCFGDGVNQFVKIECGYDGVVDFEQQTETLVRQFWLGDLGKHFRFYRGQGPVSVKDYYDLTLPANVGYISAFEFAPWRLT